MRESSTHGRGTRWWLLTLLYTSAIALVITGCGGSGDGGGGGEPRSVLLGTSIGTPSLAFRLNPANGVTTQLSSLGMDGTMVGLAYDAAADVLYGVSTMGDSVLYTIDRSTGLSTEIGSLGVTEVYGLAWDPNSSTLYGVTQGINANLITIDTTTGLASFVGELGAGTPDTFELVISLAYDSTDDVLYGFDEDTDRFCSIDTTTGAATALAASPGTYVFVGMGYDPATDTVLAYRDMSPRADIVGIDPVTGTITDVGDTAVAGGVVFRGMDGMAFDTSVGYARGTRPLGGLEPGRSALIDVNPTLAPPVQNAVSVGSTGYNRIEGLAYDPVSDTVYAMGTADLTSVGLFMKMDRTTGEMDPIGETGYSNIRSLAFVPTPAPGKIYAINVEVAGPPDDVVEIDPVTGVGTTIATVATAAGPATDMDIVGLAHLDDPGAGELLFCLVEVGGVEEAILGRLIPATGLLGLSPISTGLRLQGLTWHEGELYATSTVTQQLVKLNPVTGQATPVGSTNVPIYGLTSANQ